MTTREETAICCQQRIDDAVAEVFTLCEMESGPALAQVRSKLIEAAMWFGYHQGEMGRGQQTTLVGTSGEDVTP